MSDHIDDKQLLGYIHRTINDGQREDIESHLATCLTCRSRLAEYKSLQQRIRNDLSTELRHIRPAPQRNFEEIRSHLKHSPGIGWFSFQWVRSVSGVVATFLLLVLFLVMVYLMYSRFASPTSEQATAPTSMSVEITSPDNGSTVVSPLDLSFTVSSDVPAGFKPVVVIRDPLGQLWPWLHSEDLGNGNWYLPGVILGTNPDCGGSFTIYVVITNEDVPITQISTLPIGESHSVSVTKRCKETPGFLTVNITSPQNNSAVNASVDLNFIVTGNIPDGARPIVVVRDPLGQFWPWLHVQNRGHGNWFIPGVTLGNSSDCGQSFELHVVITDEDVLPGKLETLPAGEFDSVLVTRKC